ncbi:MAG: glycosyl transferase, family 2, partial [Campylobacterales bacterium]|nr:glycosyl transferase, family 2 [Campylobacterales bacterium]
MENKETVCAVVVTYNRKELLIECLDALMKQTRPID